MLMIEMKKRTADKKYPDKIFSDERIDPLLAQVQKSPQRQWEQVIPSSPIRLKAGKGFIRPMRLKAYIGNCAKSSKTAAISPMIRPLNHSLRKLRRCLYCLQIRNMTLMNSSPGSTNTSYRRSSLPKQSSMPKNN